MSADPNLSSIELAFPNAMSHFYAICAGACKIAFLYLLSNITSISLFQINLVRTFIELGYHYHQNQQLAKNSRAQTPVTLYIGFRAFAITTSILLGMYAAKNLPMFEYATINLIEPEIFLVISVILRVSASGGLLAGLASILGALLIVTASAENEPSLKFGYLSIVINAVVSIVATIVFKLKGRGAASSVEDGKIIEVGFVLALALAIGEFCWKGFRIPSGNEILMVAILELLKALIVIMIDRNTKQRTPRLVLNLVISVMMPLAFCIILLTTWEPKEKEGASQIRMGACLIFLLFTYKHLDFIQRYLSILKTKGN
jgi:hypothetical protein